MTISKKPLKLSVNATLFDVDGTIINSKKAIIAFWTEFGKDKPYFDSEYVIDHSHGCRTFDVIKKYAPDFADPEYVKELEKSVPDKYGHMAYEIPGSVKLFTDILNLQEYDGKQRIAVGTSGTSYMATKWFEILGLTKPKAFITSESVTKGKPYPDPYILGRKELGFNEAENKVIVFEDAIAGIQAGKAAGCFVIGIASTMTAEEVIAHGADLVVPDLKGIKVSKFDQDRDTFELLVTHYNYVDTERFEQFGFRS